MDKNYGFFNSWGYSEMNGDNVFVPFNKCNCKCANEDIADTVDGMIKEEDDKLYVNGKEVMTDNYVTGGEYDGDNGTLTLQVGEDKTTTIENLPQEMSEDDVKNILDKE